MSIQLHSVTFDADAPAALARFWATVFEAGEPEVPNPFAAFVQAPDGPRLTFLKVPEPKTAKNRCHLDLHVEDPAAVDTEAARLVAAGATMVGNYDEYGFYWATLADPEGNEFCVGTPNTPPH